MAHQTNDDELLELLGIDKLDHEQTLALKLAEETDNLIRSLIAQRQQQRLTQAQLAERMGVHQSAVARFESGERDPRLSTIRRYAAALKVNLKLQVIDSAITPIQGDKYVPARGVFEGARTGAWGGPIHTNAARAAIAERGIARKQMVVGVAR